MTTFDGVQPVAINVGPCRCTGRADTLHPEGDEVYLHPEATMTCGLRANGAIAAAGNDPSKLEALLGRVFIEEGIVGWTFTDADGDVPITPATIEHYLPWGNGGALVSERANDLYSDAILAPLVRRLANSPQRGPTEGSTSPIRPSRQQRRNSSKSSSPGPSETPR